MKKKSEKRMYQMPIMDVKETQMDVIVTSELKVDEINDPDKDPSYDWGKMNP